MILTFGADGQLGRELAECAARQGMPIRLLGRAEADIADAEAVECAMSAVSPALVVNTAAYTKVDRAESEPEAAFRSNASGPGILAAACAKAGIPLLHISTDYVFDGTKHGAYVESDMIAPLGVYGRSKAEGEANIRKALDRHVIAGMWRQGGVKCKPRCILGQDIARPAIMLHKKDRPALSARVLDQKPNPLDHGLALVWRAVGKGEHALLHVNHH